MTVELKINQKQVNEIAGKLRKYGKKITGNDVLKVIALQITDNIFQRTQAGKDVNFKDFTPYNRKYAQKEGKTAVNLTQSGGMLNSMAQKAIGNDTVKIFFNNSRARKLANIHMNGKGVPVREFFGVSTRDRKEAQQLYLKKVLEIKRGLAL